MLNGRAHGILSTKLNVRIIAATNADMKGSIERKEFREDLYYRLNVFPIHIPPLRDRREDVPSLLGHFLRRFSKDFRKVMQDFSREALNLMMRYHWPGNVRELRNVVERICIMHNVELIRPEHLPREIWGEAPQSKRPLYG